MGSIKVGYICTIFQLLMVTKLTVYAIMGPCMGRDMAQRKPYFTIEGLVVYCQLDGNQLKIIVKVCFYEYF